MAEVLVGIQAVEVSEYLMAHTSAVKWATESSRVSRLNEAELRNDYRAVMRLHRFAVINWLMQNGVSVPVELLGDQIHREVGQQMPDTGALL